MSERVERVGFVGLGRMGLPMTANLVRAGFAVDAVDVSPDARARAQAAGSSAHGDIGALAGAVDALVLMLPDSDVVDIVVTDAERAGVLTEGMVVVDMSSSQPGRTQRLAIPRMSMMPSSVRPRFAACALSADMCVSPHPIRRGRLPPDVDWPLVGGQLKVIGSVSCRSQTFPASGVLCRMRGLWVASSIWAWSKQYSKSSIRAASRK